MRYLIAYIAIALSLVLSQKGLCQEMRVALFYDQQAEGCLLTTQKDGYQLMSGDSVCTVLPAMTNITIEKTGDSLNITGDSLEFYLNDVYFHVDAEEGGFFVNTQNADDPARAYTGSLHVYLDAGVLRMVNIVPLEDYVAATVEAEGGYNADPEYYKTQAVISRTYALENLHRHEAENFQLCDGVHCQVYPGKATDETIIKASEVTHGQVIVDSSFNLINAVYHSNSGGMTANSQDVWSSALPYLVSVKDTFSLTGKHAEWKRSISLTEWRIFLENQGVNTANISHEAMQRTLKSRIPVLKYGRVSIPVKEIRKYFNLKSAWFDVEIAANDVILSGRGYGHGVGLSQEGAMAMAKAGWDYESIIRHYYAGSMVVNLKLLDVFDGLEQLSD
jgi:stage II sporulation protein D